MPIPRWAVVAHLKCSTSPLVVAQSFMGLSTNTIKTPRWLPTVSSTTGMESKNLHSIRISLAAKSVGQFGLIPKAFFFFDYEGLRLPQTTSTTRTILTPSARQGIFTYIDDDGNTRQFDVLGSQGLSINPLISSRVLSGLPTAGNNNQVGDGLNTTGFTFNQRADVKINLSTTRIDYDLSQTKSINFVWHRTTDNFLRPDTDTGGFNTTPFGSQTATTNELVGAYNWSISNRL